MKCPKCSCVSSVVIDSRSSEEGNAHNRRRECRQCHERFNTVELVGDEAAIREADRRAKAFDLIASRKFGCCYGGGEWTAWSNGMRGVFPTGHDSPDLLTAIESALRGEEQSNA